ncbi:hypothetical protein D9M68_984010 [compost metagenome]
MLQHGSGVQEWSWRYASKKQYKPPGMSLPANNSRVRPVTRPVLAKVIAPRAVGLESPRKH